MITLVPGQRVVVARAISDAERALLGRTFRFVRFAKPHGYAVVRDEHAAWWLHPESLDPVESTP